MNRRDGCLDLVWTEPPNPQHALDEHPTLGNLGLVPARAILILEYHRTLVVGGLASRSPRIVQEHECQQAADLRLVGHDGSQRPAEADRLRAQLATDHRLAR